MARSYIDCDRDQLFLLPPSMLEWLPEGDLAFFVIDAVAMIDTSAFHDRHQNDGAGRRAYHPDMMLSLLLYAYSIGMRSSRAIERACRSDVAFKVISANKVPDHGTIARFRADHADLIGSVFVDVLKLCRAAGLASLGRIAIDGTKMGSDAALDKNRDAEWIQAQIDKILQEAESTDSSEDASSTELFSVDELPEALARRGTRLLRLKAALAEVEAQQDAARAEREEKAAKATAEAEQGRRLRGRKPADPHEALARAEADLLASQVQAGRRPDSEHLAEATRRAEQALASARQAAEAAPPEKLQANITDPESRIMKTTHGWVQGYNVQAAVNENQVVIAYAATQDHNDANQLLPMIAATEEMAAAAGICEEVGLVTADAGYWGEENATAEGPDRLIATTKDWKQRKAAREMGTTVGPPPKDASSLEAMEHRLRTSEGAAAYATRSYTVEPVFGDAKENRGFRRFMRRGRDEAHGEAGLIFTTHNLLKVFHHDPSVVLRTT